MLISLLLSTGIWLYIIRKYDKYEPESRLFLLKLLLLGGFFSTLIAGPLNSTFRDIIGLSSDLSGSTTQHLIMSIFVGFNEEIMKLLCTYILIRKTKNFNEPIDGMIYALTVSLGFAAFENIQYMIQYGQNVIWVRSLMSIPGHLVFAALWGYGISKDKYLNKKFLGSYTWRYLVYGALVHAIYDFVLFTRSILSYSVIIILILAVVWAKNKLIAMANISPFMESWDCPHCKTKNNKENRICSSCGRFLRYEASFVGVNNQDTSESSSAQTRRENTNPTRETPYNRYEQIPTPFEVKNLTTIDKILDVLKVEYPQFLCHKNNEKLTIQGESGLVEIEMYKNYVNITSRSIKMGFFSGDKSEKLINFEFSIKKVVKTKFGVKDF